MRAKRIVPVIQLAAGLLAMSAVVPAPVAHGQTRSLSLPAERTKLNEELFAAIGRGNAAAVKDLLDRGADPNAVHGHVGQSVEFWIDSPMIAAARLGEVEIVKVLLKAGAAPRGNNPFMGLEPIAAAISSYHLGTADVVTLLIQAGVDPSTPPPDTPVKLNDRERAHRNGWIQRRLQEQLHDVATPGRDAARHDPMAAANKARMVIDMGVPLNNLNRLDRTPLVRLVAEGAYQGRESQLNVLELLLGRGAELNTQDVDGNTALHHAVINRDPEIAARLLKAGARADLKDEHGRTPADVARELYPHADVLAALGLPVPPMPAGGIRAHIQPSRIEGVAPLAVFFDGVGSDGLANKDFVNAWFDWEFDVTGADKEHQRRTASGFNVAHLYCEPGEYTVRMRVRDAEGKTGESSVKIKVLPFTGKTFHVAADGDDANPGTMEQPWKGFAKSLERAEPNTRILFRRGDTFPTEGARLVGRKGPVIVGAYTDPKKPSETRPLIDGTNGVHLQGVEDWRFTELHFRGQSTERSGPNVGHKQFYVNTARDILWWNLEFERLGTDAITDVNMRNNSDGMFVVDCDMHDFGMMGFYSERGTRIGLIGNRLKNMHGFEHGFRTQAARKGYIAHNTLGSDLGDVKSAIQVRGDTQQFVISHNRLGYAASFAVTNIEVQDFVHHHLAEGNVMTAPFTVGAQHVTFRNNVFTPRKTNSPRMHGSADSFAGMGAHMTWTGVDEDIRFEHNTVLAPGPFVRAPVNGLVARNNIICQNGPFVGFFHIGPDRQYMSEGNLYFAAEGADALQAWLEQRREMGQDANSRIGDPQFLSTNPDDEDFLKPAPGSPALDIGVPTGAWRDIRGTSRPQGEAPDAGAFEERE